MHTFDYVIVGAGSAGSVLANRLSADPGVRVALLEAGGPDKKLEIRLPAGFAKLFKTAFDWDYSTAKQPELADRELYWPRGRTLGGSSSINAQMWVRGHRADYDGWPEGWTYDEVEPYFRRAENRIGSNTGNVYGTGGPLHISELADPNPATKAFLAACAEAGLTRLPELNVPEPDGFAPTPVNQIRGRRWSTADGYLRPALRRPNLTVFTNTHVSRVLLSPELRAEGVAYTDSTGRTQRIAARREVIVSGGAVNSPQLLMLSGIGDPDVLAAAGVELRHALPEVGRNLQDHLSTAAAARCPLPGITLESKESLPNLLRALALGRGPLTSNVGEAVAFVRSDPSLAVPDLELVFAPVRFLNHGLDQSKESATTLGVILLQPESSGSVTIVSPDHHQHPVIEPRYLSAPADRTRLLAGLRIAERIYSSPALAPYNGGPMSPWPGGDNEAAWNRFLDEQSQTLYHPTGTCRMGSVVDSDLRVLGVDGLRVADASVMPQINRGHTHAPTVMIAEKAADLIRA